MEEDPKISPKLAPEVRELGKSVTWDTEDVLGLWTGGTPYALEGIDPDHQDIQLAYFARFANDRGDLKLDLDDAAANNLISSLVALNWGHYSTGEFTHAGAKHTEHYYILKALQELSGNGLISRGHFYISEVMIDQVDDDRFITTRIANMSNREKLRTIEGNQLSVISSRLAFEIPVENIEIGATPIIALGHEIGLLLKGSSRNNKIDAQTAISLAYNLTQNLGAEATLFSLVLGGLDSSEVWQIVNALHEFNDEQHHENKSRNISNLPRYGTFFVKNKDKIIPRNHGTKDPITFLIDSLPPIYHPIATRKVKTQVVKVFEQFMRVGSGVNLTEKEWHISKRKLEDRENIYQTLVANKIRLKMKGNIKGAFVSAADFFYRIAAQNNLYAPVSSWFCNYQGFNRITTTKDATIFFDGVTVDAFPLLKSFVPEFFEA